MCFDRFDICEAYYVYAVEYHTGQWSIEYALHSVFVRLRFKPHWNLSSESLTENGKEILQSLIDNPDKLRDRR